MTAPTIDTLPPELLVKILSFVGDHGCWPVLKAVCKHWRNVLAQVPIRALVTMLHEDDYVGEKMVKLSKKPALAAEIVKSPKAAHFRQFRCVHGQPDSYDIDVNLIAYWDEFPEDFSHMDLIRKRVSRTIGHEAIRFVFGYSEVNQSALTNRFDIPILYKMDNTSMRRGLPGLLDLYCRFEDPQCHSEEMLDSMRKCMLFSIETDRPDLIKGLDLRVCDPEDVVISKDFLSSLAYVNSMYLTVAQQHNEDDFDEDDYFDENQDADMPLFRLTTAFGLHSLKHLTSLSLEWVGDEVKFLEKSEYEAIAQCSQLEFLQFAGETIFSDYEEDVKALSDMFTALTNLVTFSTTDNRILTWSRNPEYRCIYDSMKSIKALMYRMLEFIHVDFYDDDDDLMDQKAAKRIQILSGYTADLALTLPSLGKLILCLPQRRFKRYVSALQEICRKAVAAQGSNLAVDACVLTDY